MRGCRIRRSCRERASPGASMWIKEGRRLRRSSHHKQLSPAERGAVSGKEKAGGELALGAEIGAAEGIDTGVLPVAADRSGANL